MYNFVNIVLIMQFIVFVMGVRTVLVTYACQPQRLVVNVVINYFIARAFRNYVFITSVKAK